MDPGHVFIVRGRLEAINAEAVIIPTDEDFTDEDFTDEDFTDEDFTDEDFRTRTSRSRTGGTDRVTEVASVCFQQARHAEQIFAVARLVAGEGKDAKAIASEVDVPEHIAQAALAAKGPMPGGKAALAEIKLWRAIGQTGKHSDYWDWNEAFRGFVANVIAGFPSPSPSGVDTIIATRDAFARTLAEWQKDTLPIPGQEIHLTVEAEPKYTA